MSTDNLKEKMKIFSLSSNKALAKQIADNLGLELGDTSVKTFSDGEIQININETVRGFDTYIVQSTNDPSDQHIMELLILLDAFRRASAKTINVVIPYFGYARQDRKTKSREPITAKLISDIIEKAGADRVITLDLHASQVQAFFHIPVDHLNGVNVLAQYFIKKELEDVVVVAPDQGSVKRARQFADLVHAPIAILDRRGPKDLDHPPVSVVGDIKDKTAILLDDIIDTGRRISTGAKALKDNGAKEIYAACTHPVLSGIATQYIDESPIKELVVTDSIVIPQEKWSDKMTQLSVAPIFSDGIQRVHLDKPVSSLINY